MNTSNKAVTTLVQLSENVFKGVEAYSLMANLSNLRDEDWNTAPPGGERSIADILEHVGSAKWMYQDYAFGSGKLSDAVPPSGNAHSNPQEALLDWVKEGHHLWIAGLSALSNDSELERERPVFWGELLPTRNIVQIVIAHDTYHAGEINHIRALLQKNDHWT